MSLIVQVGTRFHQSAILDPSCRSNWGFSGLKYIPQEARDCPPQVKIDISEESNQYVVSSELPGVTLRNLWVYVEGMTLNVYAGVTGEKQKKTGEYRFTEELLRGIRGEIKLPRQINRTPVVAEFDNGRLHLVFSKKVNKYSKKIAVTKEQ